MYLATISEQSANHILTAPLFNRVFNVFFEADLEEKAKEMDFSSKFKLSFEASKYATDNKQKVTLSTTMIINNQKSKMFFDYILYLRYEDTYLYIRDYTFKTHYYN